LTRTSEHAGYLTSILPAFILLGAGMSVSAVPLLTIAMADVPKADAGLASGIVNVSMWLASSAALAVFGTLAASRSNSLLAQGQNVATSLTAGYHETFMIGAILAVLGLLITVVVLWAPAREVVRAQSMAVDGPNDLSELEVMAGEF
jgi:MFS family permease